MHIVRITPEKAYTAYKGQFSSSVRTEAQGRRVWHLLRGHSVQEENKSKKKQSFNIRFHPGWSDAHARRGPQKSKTFRRGGLQVPSGKVCLRMKFRFNTNKQ